MCGIVGVMGTEQARQPTAAMARALQHRGPDGTGTWSHGAVTLGATRLALLDPSAPHQPMAGRRASTAIVFNGEIYNHAELRRELQQQGIQFSTGTDTEVVLRLYEQLGPSCLQRLQGMYALAIAEGGQLFLARDRLGIKPLFYTWVTQGPTHFLAFASEIKALLVHPAVPAQLHARALADALLIGHPTGQDTFFEGIVSLPPGHAMTVRPQDGPWEPAPRKTLACLPARDPDMRLTDAEDLLDEQLQQAVRQHMAADVDVGLMLSGGLDSSMLALYAAEQVQAPLRTYSIGDHDQNADVAQAAQVAEAIGAHHVHIRPSFAEYLVSIPAVVAAEEQPSSLYTVPLWIGCRRIGAEVKACLNGEGADELFGGYSDFLDRSPRLAHIHAQLPLLSHLAVRPSDGALAIIEKLSAPPTHSQFLEAIFELNQGDALERQHLNPLDRYSMASGLEIRVPFLAEGMLDLMARVPLTHRVRADLLVRKYVLRRLALKRFGAVLFDAVLREKVGAPVAGVFLLDRFDQLCDQTLPVDYLARSPYGRCFPSRRKLLMFELFSELFYKHRGDITRLPTMVDFIASRTNHTSLELVP